MYQQKIREYYDQLSPGYRRVADFLLNSYREAAFMTAAQVGRAARVDTTSVVRFAQRLGYPGYPELIGEIQSDVKRDLKAVYEPTPEEQTPAAIFQRNLIEDRNSLEFMLLHTEPAVVTQIVEALAAAPRIFVVGEGSAAPLADLFSLRLRGMGFDARSVASDLLTRTLHTLSMQKGDACVGISPTFATPGVAVALRIARSEGLKTIAIAGTPANPAAAAAEMVVYAPVRTSGVWASVTAVVAVLGALNQALTIHMGDRAAEVVLRADQLMQAYAEVTREVVKPMEAIMTEYNRLDEPGAESPA